MSEKRFFSKDDEQGITRYFHFDDETGQATIQTQQDVTAIIEENKKSTRRQMSVLVGASGAESPASRCRSTFN